MPVYKLTYFNARARAEVSRILFALAGVEFEDERIEVADWPARKASTPGGQLPHMTVDGKLLMQSVAIARYLAREFGYAGKTAWDQARADMIVDSLEDVIKPLWPMFEMSEESEKDALRDKYTTEKLPGFLTNYERLLEENEGPYFVGNELTWADLAVMCMLHWLTNDFMKIQIQLDSHPKLKAFMEHIENVPDIATYLKNRPPCFI